MTFKSRHPAGSARRGTVYVLVLGVSMLVLTLSLGAIAIVRTHMQNCRDDASASDSLAYAQSAIEIGRQLIAADPNWRSTRSNGIWVNNVPIGTGSLSLSVINPNGSLNNSASDPIIMTGTGVKNEARHTMQVMMTPTLQPMTCLETALCAAQNIAVSSATVQHRGTLATNNNITATSSLIAGDVEAVGTISGGTYAGERSAGVVARTVPDATVQTHYVLNGTAINFNSIPRVNGIATIDRRLLSPNNNPFLITSTNGQGIYYIDCAGAQIIIQNSRIVGTLVLLNVGPNSVMQGAMLMSPAVPNYPSLIVKGGFRIAISGNLTETGTPNVNFNPSGTPYKGVSNSTTTDAYPSELKGLLYISGALTLSDSPVIEGVIVGGATVSITGMVSLDFEDQFLENPPPGFLYPPIMTPVAGTWTRVVD